MHHGNSGITLTHPFVLYFLFFLMTAMASTSMSLPMVVLMVRTLYIRIILKCFMNYIKNIHTMLMKTISHFT